jgi:hypothetical protein
VAIGNIRCGLYRCSQFVERLAQLVDVPPGAVNFYWFALLLRMLLRGVRRDQLHQRLGVAGLEDVVVVGAHLRKGFVPALGVLPAHTDQDRAFPASAALPKLTGSIPSVSIPHRYVHDHYVRIKVPNVRDDSACAVDALGFVPMALKQGRQGLEHVLMGADNENTSAVQHLDACYLRLAGEVVKPGERSKADTVTIGSGRAQVSAAQNLVKTVVVRSYSAKTLREADCSDEEKISSADSLQW